MFVEIAGALFLAGAVCLIGNLYMLRCEREQLMKFLKDQFSNGNLCAFVHNGCRIVYRLAQPRSGNPTDLPPVCIPGGLAATMATLGKLEVELVQLGFTVLSFDRAGVGFSGKSDSSPSVEECVAELHAVMKTALPNCRKWILVGPSMGSIVAQSFIGRHPDMVSGFVNVDGLPHAFHTRREKFMRAASAYRFMGVAAYIGVMRGVVWHLSRHLLCQFTTEQYPLWVVKSQMNQPAFWAHVAVEMPLMLDLAKDVSERWAPLSVESLSSTLREMLVRVPPAQNGSFDEGFWSPLPVSKFDLPWLSTDAASEVVSQFQRLGSHSSFYLNWQNLAVRVLSARNFDYPGGESFYDAEMKTLIAAEHVLHAILAKPGSVRYVMPHIGHDRLFLQSRCIAQCVLEVWEQTEAAGGG